MKTALLYARAHGGSLIGVSLVVGILVLQVFRGDVVFAPGQPEGTLIQVWLPIGASVIAARSCYDVLGELVPPFPLRQKMCADAVWLSLVAFALLMLSGPGLSLGPEQIHSGRIYPFLPVALVVALANVLSPHCGFITVSIVSICCGIILYLLAGPTLRGGSGFEMRLWSGGGSHGTMIAILIVLFSIAYKVTSPLIVSRRR